MGGVPCTCGNPIKDNPDSLPHKTRFWTDRHHEAFAQELIDGVVAIARGYADGTLSQQWVGDWHRTRYGEKAALMVRAAELVWDVRSRWSAAIFQCDECGRLWLSRPFPPRGLAGFVPEGVDQKVELLLRVSKRFGGRPPGAPRAMLTRTGCTTT